MSSGKSKNRELPAYIRFFTPLAIQAASQALTYPLVAMVASRGDGGTLNLAGLAQSSAVIFMLSTLGFGLVSTGMVFARTLEGYQRFRSVCIIVGFLVVLVQSVLCIPQISHFLFAEFIGLPPSIEHPAARTLVATIPLQFLFFVRIPFQVVMYNALATGIASMATMLRIILTVMLSILFSISGFVGTLWAVVCLTLPVALEVAASAYLARPYLAQLKTAETPAPLKKDIFMFSTPLSIGAHLQSLSGIIIGAFISRAANPELVLPVYFLALGLATPFAYSATRVTEVVYAFPPAFKKDNRTLSFALGAGAILGLLPLLFILPGLSDLYYVKLQNLDPVNLPLVIETALALAFYPVCVAIRAQGEGLAGLAKKPGLVVIGQAVFLGIILITGAVLLTMDIAGNLMGVTALILSNLSSTIILRLMLRKDKFT